MLTQQSMPFFWGGGGGWGNEYMVNLVTCVFFTSFEALNS